jgi:hypothetical protein
MVRRYLCTRPVTLAQHAVKFSWQETRGRHRIDRIGRCARWRQVLPAAAFQAELQRFRLENLMPRVQSSFPLAYGNSGGSHEAAMVVFYVKHYSPRSGTFSLCMPAIRYFVRARRDPSSCKEQWRHSLSEISRRPNLDKGQNGRTFSVCTS